jgi:hypothetical protein
MVAVCKVISQEEGIIPLFESPSPVGWPPFFFITPIPAPPPVPTGVIMMIVEPQLEFCCDGPGRFGQLGAPAGLAMLAHYARAFTGEPRGHMNQQRVGER